MITLLLISTLQNSNYMILNLIFYSNTVFLTLDSETLCYDRVHPNWVHNYKMRLAEHLPNQPKIVVVNVFDLHSKTGEVKDKAEHLEKSGVPKVAAAATA